MPAVTSTMMAETAYDPATHVLRIRFHDGGWYRYFAVPASLYEALLAAPSHGRFFHERIKDRFPYARDD